MSDGIKPFEKSQLSTLVEQDKLYRQRDEAKKRAVGQLADYESFKNMVSTAHLAPMDTKEVDGLRGFSTKVKVDGDAPAWSFGVGESEDAAAAAAKGIAARAEQSLGSGGKGDRGGDGGAPPASAAEFERRWRALKGDAAGRLAFAALLPEGAWAELFKVEINSMLLGELADACTSAGEADPAAALRALRGAARGGRFMLSAAALGRARKAALAALVASLRGGDDEEAAEAVAKAYRLPAME